MKVLSGESDADSPGEGEEEEDDPSCVEESQGPPEENVSRFTGSPEKNVCLDLPETKGAPARTARTDVRRNENKNEKSPMAAYTLLNHVLAKMCQHRLASSFFRARYVWWSLLPSASLTLVCGVLSALGVPPDETQTTEVSNGGHEAALNGPSYGDINTSMLIISVAAALSTFLQAFSSTLRYNSRADMHGMAAERFQEIFDNLERVIIVDNFCEAGKEKGVNVKEFEDRCIEATNSCDSAVPLIVERQFRKMYSIFVEETGTSYREDNMAGDVTVNIESYDLWRLLVERLYHNIHAQRAWPWYSQDCVPATVHDVKDSLGNPEKITKRLLTLVVSKTEQEYL